MTSFISPENGGSDQRLKTRKMDLMTNGKEMKRIRAKSLSQITAERGSDALKKKTRMRK